MKNNMIRATRASIDLTIYTLLTNKEFHGTSLPEWMSLNTWNTWKWPEDGDGAPTAYHSSKLSNLSPSKSTPRNGEATLAQGNADEMLGMVGGAIPSQGHHLRDEWTSWTCTMVTIDYNGMLFYSYSIVVQYSPVVLCVVLFFKMFAPCDVLQIYQNVCFVTCEGSRKFINNARPTSWDSPPRPAVSSKSQLKSLNKSLSNLSLIMFWSQSLYIFTFESWKVTKHVDPPVNFQWLRALCCPLHLRLLRPPQIVSLAKTWLVQTPTGRSWKAERCNIIIQIHHSILHVAVYLTMSLYDIISVCTTLVASWFVMLIYHLL